MVVAIAIAGILSISLMELFSLGLGSATRARGLGEATLLAESTLERIGLEFPLVPADTTETLDRFTRHIRISPYEPPGNLAQRGRPTPGPSLFQIAVTVSWRDGAHARSVRLETLRAPPQ